MIPRLLVAVVALAVYAACALRDRAPIPPPPLEVATLPTLDLLFFTPRGWPVWGVTVIASDQFRRGHLFEVDGSLRLTVTGPIIVSVHKAGYASSPARFYLPGVYRVVLYPVSRVDE